MKLDLSKEHLVLKMQCAGLNQRANMLLAACEIIAEYRQVAGKLLVLVDQLKGNSNEQTDASANVNRDTSPVPDAADVSAKTRQASSENNS